ncbi:hypothetical protein ACFLRH_01170 [Actinomycetota bacterium]
MRTRRRGRRPRAGVPGSAWVDRVVDAPGEWVLALTAPRAEPMLVAVVGVEYNLDGQTYRIEDSFEFEVPCPE